MTARRSLGTFVFTRALATVVRCPGRRRQCRDARHHCPNRRFSVRRQLSGHQRAGADPKVSLLAGHEPARPRSHPTVRHVPGAENVKAVRAAKRSLNKGVRIVRSPRRNRALKPLHPRRPRTRRRTLRQLERRRVREQRRGQDTAPAAPNVASGSQSPQRQSVAQPLPSSLRRAYVR